MGDKMKIFAFYLPQFHEIEENNRWWGKGFTEWTNVKKAKPLFEGHQQPVKPLNDNYYNLLDESTVEWQDHLLQEYKIDGLIYYHYYFNGKMLLEKPAENLLGNKKINQSFFFCWANHSWSRSWSGEKEMLIEQTYGNRKDWSKHFDYLLPFFKDPRYELHDGKPVLMFFQYFPEKHEMVKFFDQRCKEEGFNGICIIETFHGTGTKGYLLLQRRKTKETYKFFLRQPTVCMNNIERKQKSRFTKNQPAAIVYKNGIKVIDGNALYAELLKQKYPKSQTINGLFFEWDNTPRHSERGYIITPPTREMFERYMNKIIDNEYVFVNAWNEWAEGMVLEPSTKNGYKYLDWIRDWRLKHNI